MVVSSRRSVWCNGEPLSTAEWLSENVVSHTYDRRKRPSRSLKSKKAVDAKHRAVTPVVSASMLLTPINCVRMSLRQLVSAYYYAMLFPRGKTGDVCIRSPSLGVMAVLEHLLNFISSELPNASPLYGPSAVVLVGVVR